MSSQNNRRDQPSRRGETVLMFVAIGFVILLLAVVYLAVRFGHQLAGLPPAPTDPWTVLFGVVNGSVAWPMQSTVIAVGTLVVLIGLSVGGFLFSKRRGGKSTRVDHASKYLGQGRDIAHLSKSAATATAQRLGAETTSPGVPIGLTIPGHQPLYGSWEDMHIDIWGPRTGKTTSRAVPAIMEAPGACIVTSNKRDVVDATRDPRAASGEVWVFDPQGIAMEPSTDWWWNPLSYVTNAQKAAKMAEHFASGSREPGAHTDAFFDNSGRDLLAGLLLAAAIAQRPITQVYTWITKPTDAEPVTILEQGGFPLIANQVAGVVYAPDRQRSGVYGTAQQMAVCLTNNEISAWITPLGPNDQRRQFSPQEFVRGHGTLYSLSKEGGGTAGPLVTALTAGVIEAAEELAASSAGGRLATPMLAVLDEAANVCRWKELPNLYSHYGSRGIVIMTILQSWSQGVEVWGEAGMKKLWSASNIAVYGGGVRERDFLQMLSDLAGDFDKRTSSLSTGKGSNSQSVQQQREKILDVADLQAWPKGRALVFASGARPTMVETQPWMTGPHAAAIAASIRAHDPANTVTPIVSTQAPTAPPAEPPPGIAASGIPESTSQVGTAPSAPATAATTQPPGQSFGVSADPVSHWGSAEGSGQSAPPPSWGSAPTQPAQVQAVQLQQAQWTSQPTQQQWGVEQPGWSTQPPAGWSTQPPAGWSPQQQSGWSAEPDGGSAQPPAGWSTQPPAGGSPEQLPAAPGAQPPATFAPSAPHVPPATPPATDFDAFMAKYQDNEDPR